MRPIHSARLDRVRAVLVLGASWCDRTGADDRGAHKDHGARLSTELPIGTPSGLDLSRVVSWVVSLRRQLRNIMTIPKVALGKQVGFLLDARKGGPIAAIHAAFNLD